MGGTSYFSQFNSDIGTFLGRVSRHRFTVSNKMPDNAQDGGQEEQTIYQVIISNFSSFNQDMLVRLVQGGDRLDGGEGAAAVHHPLARRRRHSPCASPPSLCSCPWLSPTEEGTKLGGQEVQKKKKACAPDRFARIDHIDDLDGVGLANFIIVVSGLCWSEPSPAHISSVK